MGGVDGWVEDLENFVRKVAMLTGPCVERLPACAHSMCCVIREARQMVAALAIADRLERQQKLP